MKKDSAKPAKAISYDHKKIEKKWRKAWDTEKTYQTLDAKKATAKKLKPYYVLDMFPYPSGSGLHVGHPRGYIASDVFARMKRMQGYNVLHPMGFDSFGLPAEQYAIQTGKNPGPFTETLVKRYREQLSILGFSYDWSREVATHRPEYYQWTQWIFLKIYECWYDRTKNKARPIADLETIFAKSGNETVAAVCNEGIPIFSAKEWKAFSDIEKQNMLMNYRLAYEGYSEVNWCPELGTVLANDEIVEKNGQQVSERGEFPVEKKSMRQWFMRITAYADRLIDGLDTIDWPDNIKEIQRNWIGKSEGSEISFPIKDTDKNITVFTTRADTLFGVTYVVLAPEHPLVAELKDQVGNTKEVEAYLESVKSISDQDRTDAKKEKTGVCLEGVFAVNPANGESVPVWIADYVLANYGTGAVMAVPAHDERDFEFAKKYSLEIKHVINDEASCEAETVFCNPSEGWLVNSDRFSKMSSEEARTKITEFVGGRLVIKYKMRDAIFARQRYWGEPIPLVHKEAPVKAFFLTKSLKKGFQKQLQKLSVGSQKHEDWGIYYFVEERRLGAFIKVSQKMLLDGAWYFDVSGNKKMVCFKKKVFDLSVLGEDDKAIRYASQLGIPNEQLDWKKEAVSKDEIIVPVDYENLPLKLPAVKSYQPSGTGESPLATVPAWVKAGYETNTMPGWAGSSWYFLRYMDPQNKKAFAGEQEIAYWKNVDMYVGGQEHATGHLLYSRFWHKFLKDLGYVKTEEPFKALRNQGLIMGPDGRKMSKRWGNVINPDDVVDQLGADTLRVYEMFMGPFESSQPWSTDSIVGARRFVERVWRLQDRVSGSKTPEAAVKSLHKTIRKVTDDIANFSFNTSVSAMMICLNEMEKAETVNLSDFKKLLQILAPFAPHVTEELWFKIGEGKSIHLAPWPKYDPKKAADDAVTMGIQVNGKVRAEVSVPNGATESAVREMALAIPEVAKWTDGREIRKFIFVPGRIISIVV